MKNILLVFCIICLIFIKPDFIKAREISPLAKKEFFHKIAKDNNQSDENRLNAYDSTIINSPNFERPALYREKGFIYRNQRKFLKALETFRKGYEIAPNDSTKIKIDLLLDIIEVNLRLDQYSSVFNDVLELFKIEKSDSLKYSDVLGYLGIVNVYNRLGFHLKAKKYLEKAKKQFEIFKKNSHNHKSKKQIEIILNFNEGNVLLSLKDFDNALQAWKKVKELSDDSIQLQITDASIGLIFFQQNDFKKAYDFGADEMQKNIGTVNGPMATFNYLQFLIKNDSVKRAREVLNLYWNELHALDKDKKENNLNLALSNLEALEGDYKNSLLHLQQAYNYLDSVSQEAHLLYNDEMDSEIVSWEDSRIQERKQTLNTWKWIGISFSWFILLVFIILFIKSCRDNRKLKTQFATVNENFEKILKEKYDIETTSKTSLEERENNLTSMTMNLAVLTEVFEEIRSIVLNRKITEKESLEKIKLLLQEYSATFDVWTLFKGYFEKLNQNFFDRLYKLHPDLTNAEIRICAFTMMGLTSKEIASMTNRSHVRFKVLNIVYDINAESKNLRKNI